LYFARPAAVPPVAAASATYAALGQAYAKKNDTANAVKSFEKAVELDPNNQNAKRQLEQLKK